MAVNYSSDERQGTVNTKAQSTDIDYTGYEQQLADLQSQLAALGTKKAVRAPTPIITASRNSDHKASASKRAAYEKQKAAYQEYQKWLQQTQAINDKIANLKSNYEKEYANKVINPSSQTVSANQAMQDAQADEVAQAQANRAANATAGINTSSAGLLGSQSAAANAASTGNSLYQNNQNLRASTQADYLERMAQSKALQNQASNIDSANFMSTLGAFFGGAGSGAAVGSAFANSGSDENMKEAPNNEDDDLLDMVRQFRSLYKRLQALKGGK